MSKWLVMSILAGVIAMAALGCGFATPEPTFPPATPVPTIPPGVTVHQLEMKNFTHQSAEIEVGDLVIWTNRDQPLHTVNHVPDVSGGAVEFNSGNIPPQESFRHQFLTPGVFTYNCLIHPISMKGTITVKPKSS